MPKTLLAVDDSATMRKVLEITFGGEDFRVVTADGATTALSRLGEEPVAAVIDTSLGTDDGYALAKEMRARDGRLALVIMASRYAPYDANRGRDAGVDDYIDKPFDTQALIEKVKKALLTRETREAAKPAPVPVPAPAASTFAASHVPRAPGAPAGLPGAAVPNKAAFPNQRTHTLSFEGGLPIVPPPAARPAPAPVPAAGHPPAPAPAAPAAPAAAAQHVPATALPRQPVAASPAVAAPAPAPAAPAAPAAHAPVASIAAAANGQLAGKLADLGLTSVQADAVLALSREVIERVVWEVVPQLAEALIKEELARLTRD